MIESPENMKPGPRIGLIIILSFVLLALSVTAYLFLVRPWHRAWGATASEVSQAMPGDELIEVPNYVTTRAVTINAPPQDVWPWLVQMGYRRGGLYSYDWLDRLQKILDRPSAARVLPEFQELKPGDEIPIGSGPGWPVGSLEKDRSLVLDIRQPGVHITWSWALSPMNGARTRLVLRIRGDLEVKTAATPMLAFLDPAEFSMVRKMLTGIKSRVEGHPQTPAGELVELLMWAASMILGLIALVAALIKRKWGRAFAVSWAAFCVIFYLTLGQPPIAAAGALTAVLLAGLIWALSARRAG